MRHLILLFLIIFNLQSFAAVTATTVWEWRQTATAAEANGCGFDPVTAAGGSGIDYTMQNAAQYSLSGMTSAGAGNVILTASAANDMLGNVIHITAGTNFTTTSPWFLITAVAPGVSLTVTTNSAGTAVTTGVGAAGTGTIGGACNFGSATLDISAWAAIQPGNTAWFKFSATPYSVSSAVITAGTAGTLALPISFSGYNTTRGDNPTGANRPSISSSRSWTFAAFYMISNIIYTETAAVSVSLGANSLIQNSKISNPFTTAAVTALVLATQDTVLNCEIISERGTGVANGNSQDFLMGNYIHSSSIGFNSSNSTNGLVLVDNIFADNVTGDVLNAGALSGVYFFANNTFYGSENKLGYGVNFTSSSAYNLVLVNNIFYGLVNAVQLAAGNLQVYDNWNNYFNNTTDVLNWTKGPNDVALDPLFMNARQVTGSSGVVSGSTLTDSGANFSNVVDGQDFVYIISGTGVTAGQYLINSHTTTVLTLNSAPGGAGSNIVYQTATGHNFAVGPSMKRRATPIIFPGALTTSYPGIGAVQRREYGKPVNKK